MKHITLLFIITFFIVTNSKCQSLSGYSIDVEYKSPNRYTADYNIEAIGINVYKTIYSKRKFELSTSIGYISYHPSGSLYSNIDDGNYYSEFYTYKLRSIPCRLIGSYKLGSSSSSTKLSLVFGIGAKKITEDKNVNDDFTETQIITEEKYTSSITGIQLDFDVYKKISAFVRVEGHSNSALNYMKKGYLIEDFTTDSNIDIQINNNTMNARFMVFGLKYNL